MTKKCYNCGMLKKTTFNCKHCARVVCLDCFNFVMGLCINCDVDIYAEKYFNQIEGYANEV